MSAASPSFGVSTAAAAKPAVNLLCMSSLPPDGEAPAKAPVDWLSIALLAIGLGCFQTFLEEGNTDDWFDSPFICIMAALAVIALVFFVFRVLASKHPVVDLRVLRYRSLAAGSVLSVVVGMALYGAMFAVPIFAATVMRYTAQDVGLMLLPGALASAAAMPVAAILMKRFDPRALLFAGSVTLIAAVLWLGRLTPHTSADDLFWPLLVRSFGSVLMFLPLSLTALGPLPKKDVAAATAIYNLTRQLGGSIGVALLATLLGNRQAFHRGVLVDHLSTTDPAVQQRLATLAAGMARAGGDLAAAKQRALALLDGSVRVQASVMAFNDTFFVTAMLIVSTLPLVFLLGKPAKGAKVDAH